MNEIKIKGKNYFGKYDHIREACRAVILDGDNILLSHETKHDVWMLPGGGKEIDETDEECVIREVSEETGYIFRPSEFTLQIGEYYEDNKFISKYFIGTIIGTTETDLTEAEIAGGLEARWLPIKEALDIFSNYNDHTYFEEKRGLYQREYSALKEILKGI